MSARLLRFRVWARACRGCDTDSLEQLVLLAVLVEPVRERAAAADGSEPAFGGFASGSGGHDEQFVVDLELGVVGGYEGALVADDEGDDAGVGQPQFDDGHRVKA